MYLKALALALRQRGHVPVLIGVEGSRLFKELQAEGLECVAWRKMSGTCGRGARAPDTKAPKARHSLKSVLLACLPVRLKIFAGNMREVPHLRKVFLKARPDVIQVNIHDYEKAGAACRLAHIKAVGFFHSAPGAEPSAVRRWLMRRTARSYDLSCFPSHFAARAWAEFADMDPATCAVVPHGIEVARFASTDPPTRDAGDTFRLVSVGRLHPVKGYPCLIDAIAELDDRRIRLDILGEGDELDALERQAARLGLQNQIFLRGHVDQPETIIKDAHAFILLSNSLESFGLALVEAMSAGLPLITSDYGPFPEINAHGVTGLVVPAGDAKATAQAIRTLADDPALCRRMGAAGRRQALSSHVHEKMVGKMIELYARLAGHDSEK